MKKLINNIMKKITNKQKAYIILSLIFISMLVMNFLTPLIADDYTYSFGMNNKHISSVIDIFIKQYHHYFLWGGRTVAHTIAQFFLMFDKSIFNIFNSFVYCLMVYLIYLHARGNQKDDNPILILVIHFLLWFFIPTFGQSFVWLIGSCNYMWTTTIILFILFQYRKDNPEKKDNIFNVIFMFLLGIIAGWTNENTSFGLIVIIIGLLFIKKITNKKYSFKKWQISGLIGSIAGFLILILSPGNYARNKYFIDNDSFIIRTIKHTISITDTLIYYCIFLFAILIIIYSIYIFKNKKITKESFVYTISGILTAYAMVLSPVFPERAWTGVIVFLIISICILIYDIYDNFKLLKFIVIDIVFILSIIYVRDYINANRSINELRNVWEYRKTVLIKAKKEKKETVYLEPYYTDNTKNPNYNLDDIVEDPKAFPNKDISAYYGIKEVKAKVDNDIE